MKSLSSADANRNFSAILREVSRGEEIVVVSRGTPVARITGIKAQDQTRSAAKLALLERLQTQAVTSIGDWTRADLYD
jgi:prevent-host-death family protein